jgi:hypothetical protein
MRLVAQNQDAWRRQTGHAVCPPSCWPPVTIHHRAGRRPPEDIDDPSFRRWLIERRYASTSELASLDAWRDTLPRDHFDIRPSVQVMRSWQLTDTIARDRRREFVIEVREAIDQVLSALDEPKLTLIRPS